MASTPEEMQVALDAAKEAQTAYWDALRDLETELGCDLDDVGDLSGYTVQDLIQQYCETPDETVDEEEADDEEVGA